MDNDNKLVISTFVDTSKFDQQISEIQRKIKNLRELGPNGAYAQLGRTYGSQGEEQKEQRMQQYRENANKQARTELQRHLQQQESLLARNENWQKRVQTALENSLKTQQDINKAEKLSVQLAEQRLQIVQNLNSIYKELGTGNPQGPQGPNVPVGVVGGGGRGGGLLGMLADPKVLGMLGSALGAGGQLYKQIGTYPERMAQREAQMATMMSDTSRLQMQGKGYEMSLFGPERAKALERAANRVQKEKVGDITTGVGLGIAGYMGGRVVGSTLGTMIGGGIGSIIPGVGTIAGGAVGNFLGGHLGGMVGSAATTMYNDRTRTMLTDRDAYKKEMGAVFAGTYQEQLAAERAKSFEKDLASQFFQQQSGTFRGLQKKFGLSDEELFLGDQSILRRGARSGYDINKMASSMMGISQAGGTTGVAKEGGQIAAQLERNLNLTNAPQLLGRISGVSGMNAIQSKDEIIRMYAEGTRIGLDSSEVKEYMQTAADIGYRSGGNLESITGLLSAGVEGSGLKSTRGIEAAQTALEDLKQKTSETGGLIGQYQIAELSGKDVTKALGNEKPITTDELAYLMGTDITKLSPEYLKQMLVSRGLKGDDTQVEDLRKKLSQGKTRASVKEYGPVLSSLEKLQNKSLSKEKRDLEMYNLTGAVSMQDPTFASLNLPEQKSKLEQLIAGYRGEYEKTSKEDIAKTKEAAEKTTPTQMTDKQLASTAADAAGSLSNLAKKADDLNTAFDANIKMGEKANAILQNMENLSKILKDAKIDKETKDSAQKTLNELFTPVNTSNYGSGN